MIHKKTRGIWIGISLLLAISVGGFFLGKPLLYKKSLDTVGLQNSQDQEPNQSGSVLSIFPSGSLENLEQTVLVSFSKPMVAMKILDQQAACPLTISPITKGSCKRISTQTVEFTPEKRNPATKYQISISAEDQVYTGTFTTPLLQWSGSSSGSLRQGIQLVFNFPVKVDQLKQNLQVKNISSDKNISVEVAETPTPGIYVVKPSAGTWDYITTYQFSLAQPLDSQDGNVPSKLEPFSYTTTDSILNVEVLQQVGTGFERTYYNEGYETPATDSYYAIAEAYTTPQGSQTLLPLENVVFDVWFDEVIDELSSKSIRITKDGKLLSYKLSYTKESIYDQQTGKEKEVLTKKKVRININDTLEAEKSYSLEYAPDGGKAISKRVFKTAASLQVTRIVPMSYAKVCVYTNNPLGERNMGMTEETRKEMISIFPEAKIRSIETADTIPYEYLPYGGDSSIKKSEVQNMVTKYKLCPLPKVNEIAYVVNTRLNPSSKYKLTFTLKDIYGSKATKIEKDFSTEKVQDKDKFIYIGHPQKNTIPTGLPIVFNVQTINVQEAVIDVCVMSIDEYLKGSAATCLQSLSKTIPIKNKNRLLTNTKIDVEQDILGEKAKGEIIRISGGFPTQDIVAKERKFSVVFVRSNLSLMLEAATNKKILLATDFNGKALPGLVFKGYMREYSSNTETPAYTPKNIEATYNAKQGVYELSDTADIIAASKGIYRGMLDGTTDIQDNYDFGYIAGNDSREKEFLYVYTERPIYKPGDTIYFKGLLRNFTFNGFSKAKSISGSLVIFNEQGEEITSIPVNLDKNSNFDGSFTLSKEIPLGMYMMRFKKSYEESLPTNATFYVEEYKKPVFKIEVDSGAKEVTLGESVSIGLNPMYYFGGKITNTKGNYTLLSQKYYFDAKDYSEFQFGEGYEYINCMYRNDCSYQDRAIPFEESEFIVGKEGKYIFNYKIPQEESEGEQLYSFIFEINDPTTQRPVSKTVSKVVHATDGYVGIQVPYRNNKAQGITLKAITLDWDAQAKPNSQVSVKIIKQDWKSVKKQGVDGVFYNDYSLVEKEEHNQIYKTDAKGLLEKTLSTQSDGEYKVLVSYIGKSGVPFSSSQVVYVSGNDPLLWRTENNSVTKVIAEKTMVNVGESAQYTIQSPINTGTIFMAVEKDDGILEYSTIPLTNYATTISLPIKKEYYPNIYLKVFIIGSQKDNPLPVYKKGLAISKINTEDQKLAIAITTDKKIYQPGNKPKITIKVTDQKNNPVSNANLSIGIVDQSLLALKGNPVKNPFAYFYDMKRYLGVSTRLSLATLVEKLEIKDTSDGSKGGDGGSLKGGNSKKKRGIFKDTAYRKANVVTDPSGIAEITADELPDNLTTWVIEVLGNTPDTRLGVETQTIQSALPLMINPNLPGIFTVGDKLILRPVIFNKTDKLQVVTFSFTGSYLKAKPSVQTINVPAQGDAIANVEVEVVGNSLYADQIASKVIMSAKTSDKNLYDEVELFIPLTYNVTKETVTSVGSLSGMIAKESLDIPKDLQGTLVLSYSKSLFGSVLEGLSASTLGVYACLEQRFSTFMPHVYTKMLYESAGNGSSYDFNKMAVKQWDDAFDGYKEISLHTYIKQQLSSLEKFQNTDGGFKFRYDSTFSQSSLWLTNYIVSSIASLNNLGYSVPAKITDRAVKYLKTEWYALHKKCGKISEEGCYGYVDQAVSILSTLIDWDAKDKEVRTMRELLEPSTKNTKLISEKLSQAIFLGKLSQQETSYTNGLTKLLTEIINEELVMNPRTAYIGKKQGSLNVSYTASLIEAMSYAPAFTEKNTVIHEALQRWLVAQKKNGSWGSTQDTVRVIKALNRALSSAGITKEEITISTDIGTKKLPDVSLEKGNPFAVATSKKSLSEISHTADIEMTSKSKEKSYYDLTLSYMIPAKNVAARYEGFVVRKNYYAYEEYATIKNQKDAEWSKYTQGKISYAQLKYPKDITQYITPVAGSKIGDVLVTIMTLAVSEPRKQIAIENFIPAGGELINYNLSTESKYAQQKNNNSPEQYYEEDPIQSKWQIVCDKEEFRTDRYFCYKESLDPGVYTVVSLIRMTHEGIFSIKPAMVFEFYNTENFGRTSGGEIHVKQSN